MVIRKVVRASALAATSLGLVVGLTGIAGASTGSGLLNVTGPDSSNQVFNLNKIETEVSAMNNLAFNDQNTQSAFTGPALVAHNTSGGGALSGNASNGRSLAETVAVTNTTPSASPFSGGTSTGAGSEGFTGPSSDNRVTNINKTDMTDTVTNDVTFDTSNNQFAASGPAAVVGNTLGGNAMSGNASNWSTESVNLSLVN